jgi:hypothetical protein
MFRVPEFAHAYYVSQVHLCEMFANAPFFPPVLRIVGIDLVV